MMHIELYVNSKNVCADVEPGMTLLDFIRNRLHLTGTKCGCDDSNCGACTVLLDGRPVKSCTMLAYQANGCQIETIEGLEKDGVLHPIQQAFIDNFAFQCGFCTPAMILTAKALLDSNNNPSENEIRDWMHGVLCRCTGYQSIVKAIMDVRDGKYGSLESK